MLLTGAHKFLEQVPFVARTTSSLGLLLIWALLPLLGGFVLDLIWADPYNLPHPIRFIGSLITFFSRRLRLYGDKEPDPKKARHLLLVGGRWLVFLVAGVSLLLTLLLVFIAWSCHFVIGFLVESLLIWFVLATKSLLVESNKVYKQLFLGNLPAARQELSMLVGRDTTNLGPDEIIKATVETIAENITDAIVAPLFYLGLGGVGAAILYKAINTLDSRVGYKNEAFVLFGRAAAKIDDFANYLPARVAALLLLLAIKLSGYNLGQSFYIFRRDRYAHLSPNSAQTEAVCAGALGIRLGGISYYQGQKVVKPTIGDEKRAPEADDIKKVQRLALTTAWLGLLVCLFLRWSVLWLLLQTCQWWLL